MNNQDFHIDHENTFSGEEIPETDTSLVKSSPMEFLAEDLLPNNPYLNNRGSRQLARFYDSAEQSERFRASLSALAMTHTAKLASLEAQISEAVPGATEHCKDIVRGYALSAIARIMKF
ncbi:MAG: hypothetical protein FWE74_05820 [Oscillospiraceae bacterium]|nr:hypothetical protein [Oscillospiraceae bacterium]